MTRRWLVGIASLLAACAASPEPAEDTTSDSAALGNGATVFALSASTAQGWSLRFQQDRLASEANEVRLRTTIVLGPKNPIAPDVNVRYDVTAADDATASGGGLLIGLAWASGYPVDQAIQILATQNIVVQVDNLVGIREAALDVGVLVGLGDAGLHAVGPGGGCIAFHAAADALQLPDGCVHDPARMMGGGGPLFSLEAVGPSLRFKVVQSELVATTGSRIQTHFALGAKTPGPPELHVSSVVAGDDAVTTGVGGLLLGLGMIADRGPAGVIAQLGAAGIPLQVETTTVTAPQPTPIPIDSLANLTDFGIASVGPGGGCIAFDAGAGTLGFALSCATGQH